MKKTALITGGTSGIGREFSFIFAEHGYDLVLVARNQESLSTIKEEITSKHAVSVEIIAKDLTEDGSGRFVYDFVSSKNITIDVLVNNAGFGNYGLFIETSWKKEWPMMELNMIALTELSKHFAQSMVLRGSGKILNVASTAAFLPGPLMAVYYATKAYVLSFSEALSNELEDTGVTVTILCPGPTQSQFQASASMENSRLVKNRSLPLARDVAEYGFRALMNGKVIAIPGIKNKIQTWAPRFLPRSIVRKIVRGASVEI